MFSTTLDTGFVTRGEFNSFKEMAEGNFIKTEESLHKINTKFDYLTETMMGAFDRVYGEFDKIGTRFNKIDERFDGLERDVKQIKDQITLISQNLNSINQHFGIKNATL